MKKFFNISKGLQFWSTIVLVIIDLFIDFSPALLGLVIVSGLLMMYILKKSSKEDFNEYITFGLNKKK